MMERLALLYSDGSIGILCEGRTIDDARDEALTWDRGEANSAHYARVARVSVTVIEDLGTAHDAEPAALDAMPALRTDDQEQGRCKVVNNLSATSGLHSETAALIDRFAERDAAWSQIITTERLSYFYFSRTIPPDRLASRHLVSGVIEAKDEELARSKLNVLLQKHGNLDRSRSFAFTNLATVARPDHSVIAITIGAQD